MADETVVTGETPQTPPASPTTETVNGEPFDAARAMDTIKKLREEAKQYKDASKKLAEMEAAEAKRKEAEMTELQKLQAQLEASTKALKAKELADARRTAAEKVGLPAALATRLQGETPDELEADVQALLDTLPKPTQPTEPAKPKSPGITNPGTSATTAPTREQRKAQLLGQPGDIWSGGGINWTNDKD